jgi:hypothetical protein
MRRRSHTKAKVRRHQSDAGLEELASALSDAKGWVKMGTDIDDLDVVVRARSGRYLARIPQLGLYATADSLPKAIEALEIKKKSLVEELVAADALDQVGLPQFGAATQQGMLRSLVLFATKGAIVVVLLLAVIGFARHSVEREIDRLQAPRIGGTVFWADMENNLARAADPANDMPAAKKQTLLVEIRVLVDRWRPFVREVGRLFSDATDTPPAKP